MNEPVKEEGTMLVTALQRRQRVSVKYPSTGAEMIEEYDASTGKLELRRWQSKNALGRSTGWIVEVGGGESSAAAGGVADLVPARNKNPVFIPQDHPAAFEWRIRNIPYPIATYQVRQQGKQRNLCLYANRGHIVV